MSEERTDLQLVKVYLSWCAAEIPLTPAISMGVFILYGM